MLDKASRINFWTIRLAVFVIVLVFNIIVLSLAGNFITRFGSDIEPAFRGASQPAWAGLAVATTVFTLIGIVPMLVVDFIRNGAVLSWIMVESAIIGFLVIFWLATAADATGNSLNEVLGIPGGCSAFGGVVRIFSNGGLTGEVMISVLDTAESLCRQQQAVQAFSFINWLLLMGYLMALIGLSLYSKSRGNDGVWKSSVRETEFFKGGSLGNRNDVPMQHSPGYTTQPAATA